jgi:hypothetical protein
MFFKNPLIFLLFGIFMTGCIVQAPKYTKIEQVLDLKLGMTQQEVSSLLKITPYDLKRVDSSGYVLIYKYRVTERSTIPLFMKPANGIRATGKWVDLFITYSPEGKITSISSCSDCGATEVKEKRIDMTTLITLIALIAPSILIALKLN